MNPVHDHVWWLISRSAGIVALLAMTVSVICGLVLANRLAGRHNKRVAAVHEHLAPVSLLAIAVHGEALLGDGFLDPTVADVLVPGLIDFKPAAVAMGIAGGYLAAALGLSFYARRRIGTKRWRSLHRFTVAAWALGVAHTLLAGTDAGSAWLRVPLFAGVGVVAALWLARICSPKGAHRARDRRSPVGTPAAGADP